MDTKTKEEKKKSWGGYTKKKYILSKSIKTLWQDIIEQTELHIRAWYTFVTTLILDETVNTSLVIGVHCTVQYITIINVSIIESIQL